MILDPSQQLHARQASYDLLARLYLAEPDAAVATYVRDLPGFAACLPPAEDLPAWLDAQAVEYQRLFGQNVYPYESLFVDPERMLNTAATERVKRVYAAYGFDLAGARVGAPDHLGLELRLMRDLVAAEQVGLEQGDPAHATWAQAGQAQVLHGHLALWAPLCAQAVARVTQAPFYRVLSTLTIELIIAECGARRASWNAECETTPTGAIEDASDIGSDAQQPEVETDPTPNPQPPAPNPQLEELGVGALVRRLLTPVEVGVFLTRADLSALGRALNLPVPVGDRFPMLRGLFAAAGQYEQVPALLAALDALWAESEAAVAGWVREAPAWAPHGRPWLARLAATRRLFVTLQAQATTAIEAPPTLE